MPTMAQAPDTEQSAVYYAAGVVQAIAARYDALPRRQRAAALVAVADFLADLRTAGVL